MYQVRKNLINFFWIKPIGTSILAPNIIINDFGFTVNLTANLPNENYVYAVQ